MPKVIVFSQIMRKNEHIAACIESVKKQSYTDFNYYIEANDITYPLLTDLVAGDKHIKIILNNSRQAGFLYQYQELAKMATYLTVIDGDDIWANDFLAKQVEFCEKNNLDIGCCSVAGIDQNGQNLGLIRAMPEEIIIKKPNFGLAFAYYFPFFRSIWGKLIASSLFDNKIKDHFPNPNCCGGYGLDTYFALEILKGAQSLGIMPDIGYHYRIGQPSASHDFKEGREFADHFLKQTIEQFLAISDLKSNNFNQYFCQAVYINGLIDSINLLKDCTIEDAKKPAKLLAILDLEHLKIAVKTIKAYCRQYPQAENALVNLRLSLSEFSIKYSQELNNYAYQLFKIWQLIGKI